MKVSFMGKRFKFTPLDMFSNLSVEQVEKFLRRNKIKGDNSKTVFGKILSKILPGTTQKELASFLSVLLNYCPDPNKIDNVLYGMFTLLDSAGIDTNAYRSRYSGEATISEISNIIVDIIVDNFAITANDEDVVAKRKALLAHETVSNISKHLRATQEGAKSYG